MTETVRNDTAERMTQAEATRQAEDAQRRADAYWATDPLRADLWATVAESYRLIASIAAMRDATPAISEATASAHDAD